MSDQFVVCPNGHTRLFYATYTHVAFKIITDASGQQQHIGLQDQKDGYIMMFHCADCGATVVVEMDSNNREVKEEKAKQ
jgi:hypothetical protein